MVRPVFITLASLLCMAGLCLSFAAPPPSERCLRDSIIAVLKSPWNAAKKFKEEVIVMKDGKKRIRWGRFILRPRADADKRHFTFLLDPPSSFLYLPTEIIEDQTGSHQLGRHSRQHDRLGVVCIDGS